MQNEEHSNQRAVRKAWGGNTELSFSCFFIFRGIYLYLQCQVTLND